MLKGINRSIIEVNDTGNEYYERAILIVKPEYSSVQREILESEAREMLHAMDAPSIMKHGRGKWKFIITGILSALMGALVAILIIF